MSGTWLANDMGGNRTQNKYGRSQNSQSLDSIDDLNGYLAGRGLRRNNVSIKVTGTTDSTTNSLVEILHKVYPNSTLTKDFWGV